jgi:hypothetical protein
MITIFQVNLTKHTRSMQLIKNIIKSRDIMSILYYTIVQCTLYQWQTTINLRKYIARFGQLDPIYRPEILHQDKKRSLKISSKLSAWSNDWLKIMLIGFISFE